MTTRSSAPAAAAANRLNLRLAAAQKQAEAAKKTAKLAKLNLRVAKQKFKEAKRAAKKLRKAVKALKAEWEALSKKKSVRQAPPRKIGSKRSSSSQVTTLEAAPEVAPIAMVGAPPSEPTA